LTHQYCTCVTIVAVFVAVSFSILQHWHGTFVVFNNKLNVTYINVKNKVYKKTVIGDVVAHLKLQKFTVSSDL